MPSTIAYNVNDSEIFMWNGNDDLITYAPDCGHILQSGVS